MGTQHLRLVYRNNVFLIGAAISRLNGVIALALWTSSSVAPPCLKTAHRLDKLAPPLAKLADRVVEQ